MSKQDDAIQSALKSVQENLDTIQGCKGVILAALRELGEEEILETLLDAEKRHPTLVEELKTAIRMSTRDSVEVSGVGRITVSRPSKTWVSDEPGFFREARRYGDTEALIEAKVINMSVDAAQISRLTPALKARYTEFVVTEKKGTPTVRVPPVLQNKPAGLDDK